MTRILQGVLDFQQRIFGKKKEMFEELGKGQKPLCLFITCSDSRINPNLLTQTEPGELFILRNAGNLVPNYAAGMWAEAATIEYAIKVLGIRDVILCGHSRCGAMSGLLNLSGLSELPAVAGWLKNAEEVLPRLGDRKSLSEEDQLARTIEQNVLVQLDHLRTHPAVADALTARTLRLHGWVYHFEQGQVTTYDPLAGKFITAETKMREKWLEGVPPEEKERTVWETRV